MAYWKPSPFGSISTTEGSAAPAVRAPNLAYYADPNAKVFQDLKAIGKAFGMPTTLIVDRNGCELASLAGPAEWASGDAVKLVQAAIGR